MTKTEFLVSKPQPLTLKVTLKSCLIPMKIRYPNWNHRSSLFRAERSHPLDSETILCCFNNFVNSYSVLEVNQNEIKMWALEFQNTFIGICAWMWSLRISQLAPKFANIKWEFEFTIFIFHVFNCINSILYFMLIKCWRSLGATFQARQWGNSVCGRVRLTWNRVIAPL